MHFKINEQLRTIAAAKGESPEAVSRSFCQFMIDRGWLQDETDNYGMRVLECFLPRYIDEICLLLAQYLGVETCPIEVYDAFKGLILWGEGNCPDCGGELKFVRTEGHELKDGDRWTPNSWEVDCYVYICPVCGQTIKSNNEL